MCWKYWTATAIIILSVFARLENRAAHAQDENTPSVTFYVTPPKWSSDGSQIAIAIDNTVEVWDAGTAERRFILEGHTRLVSSVAWSPDNLTLATSSQDQTVKLWNAADGALLQTLVGQNDSVTAVAWSPDGSQIISSGVDTNPSLFFWDVQTGLVVSMRESGSLLDIVYSPSGERLALLTPLGAGTLNPLTLETIGASENVLCCPHYFYSVVWSPDETLLAATSLNGLVTVWDAETFQVVQQFIANQHYEPDSRDVNNLGLSWVRAVTFSVDNTSIRAISGDGTINEWDVSTGAMIRTTQIEPVSAAVWSPGTEQLAVFGLKTLQGVPLRYDSDQPSEITKLVGNLRIFTPFAEPEY